MIATELGGGALPGTKVLFVDDEELALDTIGELLESMGFNVIKTDNAASAIEILKGIKVEAVLTDFMMPGMSGLRFAQLCSDNHPGIPIVLLTGADVGNFSPTWTSVQAILKKPVDPQLLIETLQRVISGSKVSRSVNVSKKNANDS